MPLLPIRSVMAGVVFALLFISVMFGLYLPVALILNEVPAALLELVPRILIPSS